MVWRGKNVARILRIRGFSSAPFSPPARAAVYECHGSPDEVLKIVDVPGRALDRREVCVKMLAAPINPSDINRIEGVYPMRPTPPAIAGGEGVGQVELVGSDVENLRVGDWVIPTYSGVGTWSTHVLKEETSWCKVPDDVPIEYLATISVNPCTAFRMLEDFSALEPGDVVVQNGATSMVGQCVIQIAHAKGLQTINIVRDRPGIEEAKEKLMNLGATEVVLDSQFDSPGFKDILANRGTPKLGLNCIGGASAGAVLKLLAPSGTMVTYGGMSKKPVTVSTTAFIFKDIRLRGFWLQKWIQEHKREEMVAMASSLIELVQAGRLKYVTEKIGFEDFERALRKALGKEGSVPKQVLVF
ncbi:hypothetical protein SELMODRAFT_92070 [Selaginella moellendorffii]|uniref:Enoyl-[acyl-carrier-protein] reductase, mitochondrial n=1 Tax=Selaginella moellendorffii TaxID=88036 RepID=D8RDS7_SELML|nr:enoyl-[acyl-carrier-protein] reductase, mitochondrial [Selaginella moellendorffii]EFJ29553.1 hypothetical protein SELMODRAFT_92070 [Selaginella moellendorffii]|eukprot:XP_002969465.1 enoyl-[acyl-carrier-protein] reductase, mitochondrial [Selaginella moellendorffii]